MVRESGSLEMACRLFGCVVCVAFAVSCKPDAQWECRERFLRNRQGANLTTEQSSVRQAI